MSTVIKSVAEQSLKGRPAANADQLGEGQFTDAKAAETMTGWDAYDVWRRFIKEARAQRDNQTRQD